MGIIESSYENIDVSNLVPSFLSWLLGGALTDSNGSLFGIGLLLVVAMTTFLTFKAFRYEKAMISSAFLTWLVALLALKAGWIGNNIFILSCVYVVVGLYYLFKTSSQEEA